MKFNKIDKIILIAGSFLLSELVKSLPKDAKSKIVVFSAKRYLDEKVPNISLKKVLIKNKVKFYQTADINTDQKFKREITKNTLGIAMGSWEFDKKTAKLFAKNHLLDFMSIDLPRYKGGAHHSWRILHQNRVGCINMQLIHGGAETFQKGEVIKRTEFDFPKKLMKPIELYNFSLKQEVEFMKNFLQEVNQRKSFKPLKLNEDQSSCYPFLYTRSHGLIDWRLSGEAIYLFINAFDEPYAGASTYLGDKKVYLKDCALFSPQEKYHPFTSGIVIRKNKKGLFVCSVGSLLRIKKVLDEKGKSLIDSVKPGDRFYTLQDKLDQAMTFKAVYDAQGLRGGKK
ncbi:hypothetical protein HYZ76_00840 [Candidatus Falkowbacteria bacterium]|nr:hypothetical protein [Candidatus Falkowbacteria bacterium]